MKRIAFAVALGTVASLTFAVPSALAKGTGWYVGASAGVGSGSVPDSTINKVNTETGISASTVSKDKSSSAFKLFLGYSLNEYLGLEGGLFRLGSRGWTALDANTGGTLQGTNTAWGGNLDLVLSLPLGNWRLFGRGGGTYAQYTMDFTSDGVAPAPATNYENTKFGWKAGAGIGYEFESNVGFRAEWERYRVDDARGEKYFVDVYSASVLYRF